MDPAALPDETSMNDGAPDGVVVPFARQSDPVAALQRRIAMLQAMSDMDNVADRLSDEDRASLGARVVREYIIDDESRSEWKTRAQRAMDLARQKKESKSFPWADASNVKYPMLTTAALQFAARAYPAIVDGPRIVKCAVIGFDPDGKKAEAAGRVSQHMSYQLLVESPEWESDVDTILHQIPIVGCAFKKVYRDDSKPAGFSDDMVSAFDLVVNQSAKSFETVPRITHVFNLYPHQIIERIQSGWFVEFAWRGQVPENGSDDDAPHVFLEQHRYYDMDEDGMPEPWIVTVHEQSQTVVRCRPGFDAKAIQVDARRGKITKIPRVKMFVKIPFVPDPAGGFYDVGFGHLLEPMADVIDTTINQMIDAGTLQNAGGGFIAARLNLGKGKSEIRMTPGLYRTVSTEATDLKNGIVNMEHPGPSKVLFDLLSLMIEAGKDVASIQDILVGDSPRNQTATTTMAMIEQGLKVFTAIYKRIFRALKEEFRIIFDINAQSLDQQKYIALLDEPTQIDGRDYQGDMDIMPVCDPNTVTDMQRMTKAQVVLEEARQGNPHVNLFEATKRAFEAARIEHLDAILVPPPDGPTPQELIGKATAEAQLEEARAKIDKLRAEVDKVAAEAAKVRAEIMIPIGQPLPIAQPQFMPETLMPQGGQDMPPPGGPPMPPEMPPGGPEQDPSMMGEVPPEAMAMMPPEPQPGAEGLPPA